MRPVGELWVGVPVTKAPPKWTYMWGVETGNERLRSGGPTLALSVGPQLASSRRGIHDRSAPVAEAFRRGLTKVATDRCARVLLLEQRDTLLRGQAVGALSLSRTVDRHVHGQEAARMLRPIGRRFTSGCRACVRGTRITRGRSGTSFRRPSPAADQRLHHNVRRQTRADHLQRARRDGGHRREGSLSRSSRIQVRKHQLDIVNIDAGDRDRRSLVRPRGRQASEHVLPLQRRRRRVGRSRWPVHKANDHLPRQGRPRGTGAHARRQRRTRRPALHLGLAINR